MPASEWTPATVHELIHMVSENTRGQRQPLTPVGGRTSLSFGGVLPAETQILSTGKINQIIDYPSRDMTITVEAGIRMADLQTELGKNNQRLPIEISHAGRATLGGAIASNASGPSRFGYGTFRDYVIGISAVDGNGRYFSSGGRVVKNVAGYDLCKLLVGSFGTLAVISSVTLKLKPLAEQRQLLVAAFPADHVESVLSRLNRSETRPVLLDVLNAKAAWQLQKETGQALPDRQTVFFIGFEGSQREVNWQTETLQVELAPLQPVEMLIPTDDDTEILWQGLIEFQTASDDPVTIQVHLLPSRCESFLQRCTELEVAVQAHAGDGIVMGHLPDSCSDVESAASVIHSLRAIAEESGGALTIQACDADWKTRLDLFGRSRQGWDLMRGIKQKLDPYSLLSPGRLLIEQDFVSGISQEK